MIFNFSSVHSAPLERQTLYPTNMAERYREAIRVMGDDAFELRTRVRMIYLMLSLVILILLFDEVKYYLNYTFNTKEASTNKLEMLACGQKVRTALSLVRVEREPRKALSTGV